jgi:hypothetical protein
MIRLIIKLLSLFIITLCLLCEIKPLHARSRPLVKCVIFVHGHGSRSDTAIDYTSAYGYWKGNGSLLDGGLHNFSALPFISMSDGIEVGIQHKGEPYHKFYVVGYDGTQAYFDAAHSVAAQIVNAIRGGRDSGGNDCSGMSRGQFVVVSHSMGATVMDFILGNSDPSDPYYDPKFEMVDQNILVVESLAGAHRGSYLALALCADTDSPLLNFISKVLSPLINNCNSGTRSLFPNDPIEVPRQIGTIRTPIFLSGGSGSLPTSPFLSGLRWRFFRSWFGLTRIGLDDGVLSFASQFATPGDALEHVNYKTASVHFSPAFVNMSYSPENHNNSRRAIGHGPPRKLSEGHICNSSSESQMDEINCRLNR